MGHLFLNGNQAIEFIILKFLAITDLFISSFGVGVDYIIKWEYNLRSFLARSDRREVTMQATTMGNHSYVRLNVKGHADDHIEEILEALNGFERQRPDLEITGWSLLHRELTYTTGVDTSPRIYGIFIDHKPRTPGK